MGYQDDNDRTNLTHGLPSFLSVDCAFEAADGEWVFKNKLGSLETDLVLDEIAPILLLISDESHIRNYIIVCTIK